MALDVLRQLELEQVGLLAHFECGHHRLVAEGVVTAHQFGPAGSGQLVEDLQQPRLGIRGAVLVTGADISPSTSRSPAMR